MLSSYIKIALRNLKKYKGYSLINIAGLGIGMACCILILLYVQHELSYDRFHEKGERIYRASREWFNANGETSLHLGHVAPPIGPLLAADFPEIEEVTRLLGFSALVSQGERFYQEDNIFFAEANLFKVFTFPFLQGNPESALAQPNSVVISESTARKYFPDGNALDQSLRFSVRGMEVDFKVTGVTADVPANSHFHYDFLVSFITYEAFGTDLQSWGSNNYSTYLLLPAGMEIAKIAAQIPDFIARHHPDGEAAVGRTTLNFMNLRDIHLHSQLDSEIEANGDINNVYIFSAIAALILLIACINFMNLATARSARRAKEVGMRKVAGANRVQLIGQFLGESVVYAILAMVLALLLVAAALPAYSNFLGYALSINMAENGFLLLGLLGMVLLVGIAAGSYPAFFLSSFRPVVVLKGTGAAKLSGHSGGLRKSLVVLQFAISIVLMVAVGVVYQQLDYVHNKDLGYDKSRIALLPAGSEINQRFQDLQARLLLHPAVEKVSLAKRVPTGRLLDSWGTSINYVGTDQPIDFRIAGLMVDHTYIPTYGIPLAAGRNFSRELASDSSEAFILNESAVRQIGWQQPADAVGEPFNYGDRNGYIIGVVKDFHFESLRNKITPICMMIATARSNTVSVKISEQDIPGALAFLKEIWQEYRPNNPFEYEFVDERFQQLYRDDERLMTIFGYFSILAILIACLGLFGLASFSAEQRIKEIGIRKVLGAPVSSLVLMLSQEFTKFVLLANILAWPAAYFAMKSWLAGFAYHTELGVTLFIVAMLLAFAIALLTVSYQAVKTSLANPVKALRYE